MFQHRTARQIIHVILILVLFAIAIAATRQEQPNTSATTIDIWSQAYWLRTTGRSAAKVNPKRLSKPARENSSQAGRPPGFSEDTRDIPVTNEYRTSQSENSVFVDPHDNDVVLNSNNSSLWPLDSLALFLGTSGFVTADGGMTWTGQKEGTGGRNIGDPAAVIGLNGVYYIGHVAEDLGQGIALSTDGGATWTQFQVAPNPGRIADKNHLWIDNSVTSPFEGHLYSSWTQFGGEENQQIAIARSTKGGSVWSSPMEISSAANAGQLNQGVNLKTGPGGEVYAVWAVYDLSANAIGEDALGFARSFDGGASFKSAKRAIDGIRGIRALRTSKDHRVNSFPAMAVDISGGPNNGAIYVVWTNSGVPGINVGPDIDIYLIKSVDKGVTWSAPVRVNQDPIGQGKEHYFPWITCDPVTGGLSVIFYDDRNVDSTDCEVFVANSGDGGVTWVDFQVSDVSFTPMPAPGFRAGYFGDYLGISARGGKVYPMWTDNRLDGVRPLSYASPYEFLFCPSDVMAITSVTDVPDDQGGQVRVSWMRSPYDIGQITEYAVYRTADMERVATLPATSDCDYSTVAATQKNAHKNGAICYSSFFVRALTSEPSVFFDSLPDSGSSVDNLAPATPTNLSVAHRTGVGNRLTWDYPVDIDFEKFRVYRSVDPEFSPLPAHQVAAVTVPIWIDPDSDEGGVTYKVTALDISGNESEPARVTTIGDRRPIVSRVVLHPNVPNPFNPKTIIRFDLPADAKVSLAVYDVEGRLVRSLVDGRRSAGRRRVTWNGRDDRGRPQATGTYFYKLRVDGSIQTRKMLLLK